MVKYQPNFKGLKTIKYNENNKYYNNIFYIESKVNDPEFYEDTYRTMISITSLNKPLEDEKLAEEVYKKFFPNHEPYEIIYITSKPSIGAYSKIVVDPESKTIYQQEKVPESVKEEIKEKRKIEELKKAGFTDEQIEQILKIFKS